MSKVLIVAELGDDGLSPATARTLSCAANIPDAQTDIVIFAAQGRKSAEQAAGLAGVARVLLVESDKYAHPLAAILAPELAVIAADYTHVLAPSTTFGRDLLPCVAALLGTVQISDVMAVESATRFRRPIYAGNAIATVETDTLPVVATARIASFAAAGTSSSPAPIETRSPTAAIANHTRFVSRAGSTAGKVDLQSARRVVAGGRGVGSAENFALIDQLAATLGAAIGASRAAVDAGFIPNESQVGQTGKIIAPDLYVAIGISGAIQHLTGIRDAGTIVAINQDAEAPIFDIADIGLVGDLFEIVPELCTQLSAD